MNSSPQERHCLVTYTNRDAKGAVISKEYACYKLFVAENGLIHIFDAEFVDNPRPDLLAGREDLFASLAQ